MSERMNAWRIEDRQRQIEHAIDHLCWAGITKEQRGIIEAAVAGNYMTQTHKDSKRVYYIIAAKDNPCPTCNGAKVLVTYFDDYNSEIGYASCPDCQPTGREKGGER